MFQWEDFNSGLVNEQLENLRSVYDKYQDNYGTWDQKSIIVAIDEEKLVLKNCSQYFFLDYVASYIALKVLNYKEENKEKHTESEDQNNNLEEKSVSLERDDKVDDQEKLSDVYEIYCAIRTDLLDVKLNNLYQIGEALKGQLDKFSILVESCIDKYKFELFALKSAHEQIIHAYSSIQMKSNLNNEDALRIKHFSHELLDGLENVDTLGEAQNKIVQQGIEYSNAEKPGYEFASLVTLYEMLMEIPRNELLANVFQGIVAKKILNIDPNVRMNDALRKQYNIIIAPLGVFANEVFLQWPEHNEIKNGDYNEQVEKIKKNCRHMFIEASNARFSEQLLIKALEKVERIAHVYDQLKALAGQKPEVGKIRLLVLSDSVGAGYRADEKGSWVFQLQDALYPNIEIINCAVPGFTTEHGIGIISKLLSFHQPNIVGIALGGNDACYGHNALELMKHFVELISIIRNYDESIRIRIGVGVPGPILKGANFSAADLSQCVQFLNGNPETDLFKSTLLLSDLNAKDGIKRNELTEEDKARRQRKFDDKYPVLRKSPVVKAIMLPEDILSEEKLHSDKIHLIDHAPIVPIAKALFESDIKEMLDLQVVHNNDKNEKAIENARAEGAELRNSGSNVLFIAEQETGKLVDQIKSDELPEIITNNKKEPLVSIPQLEAH